MKSNLIRRLEKKDIPEFVEMRKLQLLEEGAVPTTDLTQSLTDYFLASLEDGSFVSWIALVDGKLIATSGIVLQSKATLLRKSVRPCRYAILHAHP